MLTLSEKRKKKYKSNKKKIEEVGVMMMMVPRESHALYSRARAVDVVV